MKTYKTLTRGNIKSDTKTNNQFMGNHRISISNELLLINGRFCLPRITTNHRQTDRLRLTENDLDYFLVSGSYPICADLKSYFLNMKKLYFC